MRSGWATSPPTSPDSFCRQAASNWPLRLPASCGLDVQRGRSQSAAPPAPRRGLPGRSCWWQSPPAWPWPRSRWPWGPGWRSGAATRRPPRPAPVAATGGAASSRVSPVTPAGELQAAPSHGCRRFRAPGPPACPGRRGPRAAWRCRCRDRAPGTAPYRCRRC